MLVLAAVVAGAWLVRRQPAAEVRTVVVREAGQTASGGVLNASGYVTARRRATVSAKITGRLSDVRVEEGMPVQEGQVLARIDDSQFRARLELAESRLQAARSAVRETGVRLDLAELNLERIRRLVADGVTSQAQLDEARTSAAALRARLALEREQVQVAEREVALSRTELADTVITAPFSGVVISKDAQPGEIVSPVSAGGGFTRTGICTVVDMDSLEIEVDVSESYIARVRPDQPVEAILDAYPEWRVPARVITTIPAADRQKATVLVRIAFEALDARILPDMGVKVTFLEPPGAADDAGAARDAALLAPRAAVRRDGGQDVLFVVKEGRAERRAVRLGFPRGDDVEVLAGVVAGERVVLQPADGLADGDPVDVR